MVVDKILMIYSWVSINHSKIQLDHRLLIEDLPYNQLLPYLMGTSFLILLAIIYFPKGSIWDWKNLFIMAFVFYLI